MPIEILPDLKKEFPKLDFFEFDVVDDLSEEGKDLVIIDSAEGINNVCLITDIDLIETSSVVSMHDFDLAYNLKLMKKTGIIKSVKLYCIPRNMTKDEAIKQIVPLIKSTLF